MLLLFEIEGELVLSTGFHFLGKRCLCRIAIDRGEDVACAFPLLARMGNAVVPPRLSSVRYFRCSRGARVDHCDHDFVVAFGGTVTRAIGGQRKLTTVVRSANSGGLCSLGGKGDGRINQRIAEIGDFPFYLVNRRPLAGTRTTFGATRRDHDRHEGKSRSDIPESRAHGEINLQDH